MMKPMETTSLFICTNEEIGAFIGVKYKIGNHIKKVIEGVTNTTLTIPGGGTPYNNGKIDPLDQVILGRSSYPTWRSMTYLKTGCRRRNTILCII